VADGGGPAAAVVEGDGEPGVREVEGGCGGGRAGLWFCDALRCAGALVGPRHGVGAAWGVGGEGGEGACGGAAGLSADKSWVSFGLCDAGDVGEDRKA